MPDDEGMFKSTRFIDLSNNNLTGSIPNAWSTIGVFTLVSLLALVLSSGSFSSGNSACSTNNLTG